MNYKEIEYKKYGKCLKISNDFVELITTLDVGPRIISFRRLEGENIFWEDLHEELIVSDPKMDEIFYKGVKWNSYGGHRLWKAPEDFSTYYPDDSPIDYEVVDNTVHLIQPVQIATELQMIISITLNNGHEVFVNSKLINRSKEIKKVAPWSLSMCKGPGLLIAPLPNTRTDFKPQVFYSLWNFGAPYNDPRCYYGKEYFSLKMEPNNPLAYKVGINIDSGKVMYLSDKDVLIKKFARNNEIVYPDNNVNFETYTKDLFLEIEVLGEYKTIKPNEEINLLESWVLKPFDGLISYDKDETIYKKYYNKYCND